MSPGADRKPIKQEKNGDKGKSSSGKQRRFYNRPTATAKFKGKTSDLEGHLYDVGVMNQAQIFANTTREVA